MKEDRLLTMGEFEDLLDSMKLQEIADDEPLRYGEMRADISNGKLTVHLELDVTKLPAEITLFPQNFFRNWLRRRLSKS